MPANQNSLLQSLSSSSEATLCHQYEVNINQSHVWYNHTGRAYSSGLSYIPYPLIEDVYNQSNHTVTKDDDFTDLGLNNFISARCRIAQHQLNCHCESLNVWERGLLGQLLKDWDQDEGSDKMSGVIDMCMSYTTSVGIQGAKWDIVMMEAVCLSFCLWLVWDWWHWEQGVTYPGGALWVHGGFWNNSPPLYPASPWWVLFESTHQFTLKEPTR